MLLSGILLALVLSPGPHHVEAAPATRQALRCVTSSFTNVVTLPGVAVTIEKVVSVPNRGTYR